MQRVHCTLFLQRMQLHDKQDVVIILVLLLLCWNIFIISHLQWCLCLTLSPCAACHLSPSWRSFSGQMGSRRCPSLCAVCPAKRERGRRGLRACLAAGTVSFVMAISTSTTRPHADCVPTTWGPTPTEPPVSPSQLSSWSGTRLGQSSPSSWPCLVSSPPSSSWRPSYATTTRP